MKLIVDDRRSPLWRVFSCNLWNRRKYLLDMQNTSLSIEKKQFAGLRKETVSFMIAAVVCASAPLLARHQQLGSGGPSFEVASVKLNTDLKNIPKMNTDPSGIIYTWVTLTDCIEAAYGIKQYQVGPAWMSSVRYDISARAPAGASTAQFMTMLQTLLSERFKLQFHREKRGIPVYVLQAGKRTNLTASTGDEPSESQLTANGFVFRRTTMAEFVRFLSSWPSLGRPVTDQTGLDGRYDFTFNWFDSGGPSSMGEVKRAMASGDPSAFVDAVARLGLQLELKKSPADALVIDRIERVPTQN
jgi:uncharacterized protein (TIGR03435 family)